MRLRDALPLAVAAIVATIVGCGGKSYVTTSLGREHHVEPAASRIGERKAKRGPEGSAAAHRDLAGVPRLLSAGEFADARRVATDVLKRHPDSVEAHTYLAVALEGTGQAATAGSHYLRATEIAPNHGGVLGNYGIWLCGQGRAAESLGWFERAQAAGQSALVLANAGACAAQAGDDVRAERELRRAIELDPENPLALGALAQLSFRAGNAFEARAFSERRLAAAPADAKALLLASQIEQKLGDSAAAARYVSRLNAEFPDAMDARNSAMGDGGRQ